MTGVQTCALPIFDRKPIKNVKEFEEMLSKKKGKSVLLTIALDKENNRLVGLEIPN